MRLRLSFSSTTFSDFFSTPSRINFEMRRTKRDDAHSHRANKAMKRNHFALFLTLQSRISPGAPFSARSVSTIPTKRKRNIYNTSIAYLKVICNTFNSVSSATFKNHLSITSAHRCLLSSCTICRGFRVVIQMG